MQNSEKKIIGRLEIVDFPRLQLNEITAKIDTGAYTSSLHCHNINTYIKDGLYWVQFNLLDPDHEQYNEKLFDLPIYDEREVKSSNGLAENRVFILTQISLFNQLFDIELSLTDRSKMRYPVLIGRKFLKKKFLVDVDKKHESNKMLKLR